MRMPALWGTWSRILHVGPSGPVAVRDGMDGGMQLVTQAENGCDNNGLGSDRDDQSGLRLGRWAGVSVEPH